MMAKADLMTVAISLNGARAAIRGVFAAGRGPTSELPSPSSYRPLTDGDRLWTF
jgi:hypothetical protein